MSKKFFVVISVLLIAAFAFASCAPAEQAVQEAPAAVEVMEEAPAEEPAAPAEDAAPAEEAAAEEPAAEEPAAPAMTNLILATTTSTQDSGLLDVLVPMFQDEYGYVVQTVAVGSGAALEMGVNGDADVLLVHSPAAEVEFMDGGNGKDRQIIMHNDFVIVGPSSDPAGIKGMDLFEGFKAIYDLGTTDGNAVTFVARGDKSGTSTKELGIWKKAEIDPATEKPNWYVETGQGMGASLTIASEKAGYTITDRATYLANKDNFDLEILIEGHPLLLNVYHVMTVSPDKYPNNNYQGAVDFLNFMIADNTQAVIGEFGVDKFGSPLFFPDADKQDSDFGL